MNQECNRWLFITPFPHGNSDDGAPVFILIAFSKVIGIRGQWLRVLAPEKAAENIPLERDSVNTDARTPLASIFIINQEGIARDISRVPGFYLFI